MNVKRLVALRKTVLRDDPRILPGVKFTCPAAQERKEGEIGVRGGPLIMLTRPIRKTGKTPSTQLFTWTGKMRCPSLSISAGPFDLLGSCAMAKEEIVRSIEDGDPEFLSFHPTLRRDLRRFPLVCDTCYARKGRYAKFETIVIKQRIVREWMDKEFALNVFEADFKGSVDFLASDFIHGIMAADGIDTRYFRLFDSGEIYAPRVYLGLRNVAATTPNVKFWLPTRMWVFAEFRALVAANPPPRNLVIRPSGLFIDGPPPVLPPPFAAGSMIYFKQNIGDVPEDVWPCPAYKGKKTESCTMNHMGPCRRCWDEPMTPVAYKYH